MINRENIETSSAQVEVCDHLEILNLYARYTHTIDQDRLEDWVKCYVEDGYLSIPAIGLHAQGPADLKAFARKYSRRSKGLEKHLMTNIAVWPGASGVEGSAYLTMVVGGSGEHPPRLHTTGRYDDVLTRTVDGWRFVSRVLTLDEH